MQLLSRVRSESLSYSSKACIELVPRCCGTRYAAHGLLACGFLLSDVFTIGCLWDLRLGGVSLSSAVLGRVLELADLRDCFQMLIVHGKGSMCIAVAGPL